MQSKQLKILIIGETGAGKTSLINLMYCWSKGLSPENIIRRKKVLIKTKYLDGDGEAEGNVVNQGESQTRLAKVYQFELKVPEKNIVYQLNLLDTPGMGDTRGRGQDEQNIELIVDAVTKTENLNAIVFVLNGSEARINSRIKLTVQKLSAMIPDALAQNSLILLTNVDLKPKLAVDELFSFPIEDKRKFYYNNQLFNLEPKYFNDKNLIMRVGQTFNESLSTISAMLEKIESMPVVATQVFQEVKYARDKLTKDLIECREIICRNNRKKQELEKMISKLKMEKFETQRIESQLESSEPVWVSKETPHHNTICSTCKNTCHKECSVEFEKGLDSCIVFLLDKIKTTICNKCGHSLESHKHLKEIYIQKTEDFLKFQENGKQTLEKMKNGIKKKRAIISMLKYEIEEMEKESLHLKDKILSLILELKEICSSFDFIGQIDTCIKVFQEKGEIMAKELNDDSSEAFRFELQEIMETETFMEELKQEAISALKPIKDKKRKSLLQSKAKEDPEPINESLQKRNVAVDFYPLHQNEENKMEIEYPDEIRQQKAAKPKKKKINNKENQDSMKSTEIEFLKMKTNELAAQLNQYYELHGYEVGLSHCIQMFNEKTANIFNGLEQVSGNDSLEEEEKEEEKEEDKEEEEENVGLSGENGPVVTGPLIGEHKKTFLEKDSFNDLLQKKEEISNFDNNISEK